MPDEVKRIVCLANSRKLSGRCIAGKELLPDGSIGAWIRPVTRRENGEVPLAACRYPDHGEIEVLDVLDIRLQRQSPKDYQQENWTLNPTNTWSKVRELPVQQVTELVDAVGLLWTPGHKTMHGLNDRVPFDEAVSFSESLKFIEVRNLKIRVFVPGESFGETRRRVQGRFRYNHLDYWLWVTDALWEREYLQKADGYYFVGQSYLTISLGEPHEGYAYKLIAAIITH